jgi:hypothetical protein
MQNKCLKGFSKFMIKKVDCQNLGMRAKKYTSKTLVCVLQSYIFAPHKRQNTRV